MSPAASASYRLPHRRRWTGSRLRYASDGTSPATVAESSNSNSASRRVPKHSYTPARNCRRVLKVAGSIMPDPTGQNRPASRNRAYPPCGVKSQAKFLDLCALHLRHAAAESDQTSDLSASLAALMTNAARRLLERD